MRTSFPARRQLGVTGSCSGEAELNLQLNYALCFAIREETELTGVSLLVHLQRWS